MSAQNKHAKKRGGVFCYDVLNDEGAYKAFAPASHTTEANATIASTVELPSQEKEEPPPIQNAASSTSSNAVETETNETGVVIINAKFSSNVFTGASSVEVLDSATGNSPQQAKHGLSVPLSLLLIPVAAIILCIVLRRRQKHSTKQAQQAIYQDRVGTASPGSGSPYCDFFQKGKSVHNGNRWESDVDDSEHEEHCPPYRHKRVKLSWSVDATNISLGTVDWTVAIYYG